MTAKNLKAFLIEDLTSSDWSPNISMVSLLIGSVNSSGAANAITAHLQFSLFFVGWDLPFKKDFMIA